MSEENPGDQGNSQLDKLWTVDEVSHYLRLESETVRVMARKGILPAKKIGKVWRFSREQIIKWVGQLDNHPSNE